MNTPIKQNIMIVGGSRQTAFGLEVNVIKYYMDGESVRTTISVSFSMLKRCGVVRAIQEGYPHWLVLSGSGL